MSSKYSDEFHDFMRDFIPGHTSKEVSVEIEKYFGFSYTPAQVKSYKQNHHIKSGTRRGLSKDHPSKEFPEEVAEYIRRNVEGIGPAEMAKHLNAEFGMNYTTRQIKGYYGNHRLSSGLTGRFEKGHIPPNRGKKGMPVHPNTAATQFKKGHTPKNKLPIDTVLVKDDGYLWRKIGEGCREWKQEHILIWEAEYGPIPEGHLITFLDGNKLNVSLNNLRLVNKKENLTLNRRKLRSRDPQLTETGILVTRLRNAAGERMRK